MHPKILYWKWDDSILDRQIFTKKLKDIVNRCGFDVIAVSPHDIQNIDLSITDSAKDILINEGYDPIYGARPLKRYIGNILETKIAKMIIAGQITDGCNLIIDGIDDKIEIRPECK